MEQSQQRYICVHGHFYQPPRENPWLEAVEIQDSAAPYHDWNERITAEGKSRCQVAVSGLQSCKWLLSDGNPHCFALTRIFMRAIMRIAR